LLRWQPSRANSRPRTAGTPTPRERTWTGRSDVTHPRPDGENVMTADEGDLCALIRCSDQPGSTPPAPIDSPRLRTSRDFTFLSSEASQHFYLLALGHLEIIKSAAQLRSDFVEHGR